MHMSHMTFMRMGVDCKEGAGAGTSFTRLCELARSGQVKFRPQPGNPGHVWEDTCRIKLQIHKSADANRYMSRRFYVCTIWIIYGYRIQGSASKSQRHPNSPERVSKGEVYYGKRKLVGIGLSLPMSVMRRWRAFCGRGLDLVHARLSPVLRQTRSQYFQRAVVPELLLRIRTLLSRRQLLIRSVPRPKKWPIRLCCLLVQTEEWPVCLCCLLVLLLCHLFHKINHLKIFLIRRW